MPIGVCNAKKEIFTKEILIIFFTLISIFAFSEEIVTSKNGNKIIFGDNQNNAGSWRNGGRPSEPDIYMFLLSDSGGPY